MGKLTDSLKAASRQLEYVQHGIHQMRELGQELADNTLNVAESALRTGYAYAKAEAGESDQPVLALPDHSPVLDRDHLKGSDLWTEALVKTRFGHLNAAYRHLRDVHGIKLQIRSWNTIVDAFNGKISDRPIAQRVAALEQTVAQQEHRIANLEAHLDRALAQLQQLVTIVERSG